MTNLVTTSAVAAVSRRWNSLGRLRAGLLSLFVVDLLFLAAMFTAGRVHQSQLQTIGRDSAPSVIAAQQIKVAIADMDAEAANELLSKPGEGADAVKAYNTRREQAAEALISAAQNITYGDAERLPIKRLQVGLGEYEIKIQRARDFHERNDPGAIAIYRQATSIVADRLFPAADALEKANDDVLETTFETGRTRAAATRTAAVLAGFVLLAILVYIQWDLTKSVRRLLNPGLLASSVLTLALLFFAVQHLSKSAEELRLARQDAFTSLDALWQARSLAYSANADESKFLLQANGDLDEKAFFQKTSRIWSTADTPSYLEQELKNITFRGEKEAADETIRTWEAYLKTDSLIRQLKTAGDDNKAIRLCLGRNPGQSDWQFARFDEAMQRTIDVNQQAFDRSVASGFEQLTRFTLVSVAGTVLIAICFAAGLLIRIREFL